MSDTSIVKKTYPLLPLRDVVIFPQMMVPLYVGRARSIQTLEAAMKSESLIFLVAQKAAKMDEPDPGDLFSVGTVGQIKQMLKLPDGTVRVMVEGKSRARVDHFIKTAPYFEVEVELIEEVDSSSVELSAVKRSLQSAFETYLDHARRIPKDILKSLNQIESASKLADTIALSLNLKLRERQELLEILDPRRRLERLYAILQREIEILQVEQRIKTRIKKQMEQSRRDPSEDTPDPRDPSGAEDFKNELKEIEDTIRKKGLSEEARTKAERELRKLKMMSPMSAEATVIRNYLDWLLALPWGETTKDIDDIEYAEKVLDEDHYGLKKPKERVLEYLAVKTLAGEIKGPILCLAGPAGVGKTSLVRSIARAAGRKYVRIALGGVRDEAEVRGHRRTYIGALPGKLIHSMRKGATDNPVILLDEIDKLSSDYRGDPSSALLEALDPEQNNAFNDHYLDVDYDLSKVMFVCTANYLNNIHPTLRDRMEIINLSGYTLEEKVQIAKRYLLPKQQKENGLAEIDIRISDATISEIVQSYTREAGVRGIERETARLMRKIAIQVLRDRSKKSFRVTPANIEKFLGVPKFRKDRTGEENRIGLANGLAWTEVGGALLSIEVSVVPGSGKLVLTGKLGDVMKESAQAALGWVRSKSDLIGLPEKYFQEVDINMHVPEGAVPKDGPSAGITITSALVSALTGVPVRHDIAMTGEVTLHGRVLPIGGLKEKILAAHRHGIMELIIPEENAKDLKDDMPPGILKVVKIHLVSEVEQVLDLALVDVWQGSSEKKDDEYSGEMSSTQPTC